MIRGMIRSMISPREAPRLENHWIAIFPSKLPFSVGTFRHVELRSWRTKIWTFTVVYPAYKIIKVYHHFPDALGFSWVSHGFSMVVHAFSTFFPRFPGASFGELPRVQVRATSGAAGRAEDRAARAGALHGAAAAGTHPAGGVPRWRFWCRWLRYPITLIGKSSINSPFSIAMLVSLPEGSLLQSNQPKSWGTFGGCP